MLLFRILNFIAGYRYVVCGACYARDIINILMKNEIDYWSMSRDSGGELKFYILEREWKRLCKIIPENKAVIRTERRYGLPQFLYRYRLRIGVPLGAVMIVFLLSLSTQYVWDVRVTGNDRLSDEEIVDALDSLGFGVGSHIPDVDYYSLCHKFILENDCVSWISVNMVGTTAEVRILERNQKGDIENDNGTPSNLVAARDGIIVRTETESGATAVIGGQEVKKGELLVSGIVQTDMYDEAKYVLVRSKAKIYAQTERVFKVSVALEGTKDVYIGKETLSKSVKFFGKSINLTKNSSISDDKCDIIEDNRRVVLFEGSKLLGSIPLPVWVCTECTEKFEQQEYTLTEEQALKQAQEEMSKLISSELEDAEILTREIMTEMTENDGVPTLVLTWAVTCVENIGEEVPIGIK